MAYGNIIKVIIVSICSVDMFMTLSGSTVWLWINCWERMKLIFRTFTATDQWKPLSTSSRTLTLTESRAKSISSGAPHVCQTSTLPSGMLIREKLNWKLTMSVSTFQIKLRGEVLPHNNWELLMTSRNFQRVSPQRREFTTWGKPNMLEDLHWRAVWREAGGQFPPMRRLESTL